MDLPLILDNFVFQAFEIPETFRELGGKQAHSLREYPGGLRTIRTLGFFPLPLQWSGYLTGPIAFARAAQLERKAVAANSVKLTYGPWSWLGIVVRFTARPRHQYLVPYEIMFEPTQDLSGIASNPSGSQPSAETQMATQTTAVTKQQGGTVRTGTASTTAFTGPGP